MWAKSFNFLKEEGDCSVVCVFPAARHPRPQVVALDGGVVKGADLAQGAPPAAQEPRVHGLEESLLEAEAECLNGSYYFQHQWGGNSRLAKD